MGRISQKPGKVLVAVNFDDNGRRLVAMAAGLCRKARMTLRLTHVAEPIFPTYMALGSSVVGMSSNVFQTIQNEAAATAARKLRELASSYNDIATETCVLPGIVAASLADDMRSSGATLAIVGSAKGSHKLLLRGFSTAMELMHDSPVPILVVPGTSTIDFMKSTFRIMIADDLREETLPAVETAFDLGSWITAQEILQLHASTMTEDMFKTTLHSTLIAAHNVDAVSVNELWDFAQKQMHDKLEGRAAKAKLAFKAAGGHVKSITEVGRVQEEILRHVSSYQPDLVIFGRHQKFHGKSLAYGQLPFHLMLALERPIMVVPNIF